MRAGDIAAAIGLKDTRTGDTLCDDEHPIILEAMKFPAPVIDVSIEPKTKADQDKLGIALASSGKPDEALDAYKKALELDPASRVARLGAAELFLRLNKGAEAAFHAEQALQLEPDDAVAHNLLGAGLASQGKLAEAVEHFRAALTLAPDHKDARRNLEQATRLLGDRR